MKNYILTLLSILCVTAIYAQNLKSKDPYKNENFFGIVKFGIGLPLSVEHQQGHISKELGSSKTSVYSLNAIGGWVIVPEFSVGLGLGLDGFHSPSSNTFPLYLDLRYYTKDEGNTWYGLLDYGRGLKLNDTFRKGELIRIGVGYKFFTGNVCWLADMHYGQYDVSLDGEPIRKTQYLYSYKKALGFSIGILF